MESLSIEQKSELIVLTYPQWLGFATALAEQYRTTSPLLRLLGNQVILNQSYEVPRVVTDNLTNTEGTSGEETALEFTDEMIASVSSQMNALGYVSESSGTNTILDYYLDDVALQGFPFSQRIREVTTNSAGQHPCENEQKKYQLILNCKVEASSINVELHNLLIFELAPEQAKSFIEQNKNSFLRTKKRSEICLQFTKGSFVQDRHFLSIGDVDYWSAPGNFLRLCVQRLINGEIHPNKLEFEYGTEYDQSTFAAAIALEAVIASLTTQTH